MIERPQSLTIRRQSAGWIEGKTARPSGSKGLRRFV